MKHLLIDGLKKHFTDITGGAGPVGVYADEAYHYLEKHFNMQLAAVIRGEFSHICAYCGDNRERSWEDMREHIKVCEEHPAYKYRMALEKIRFRVGDECHDSCKDNYPCANCIAKEALEAR
jgi:hypothetical protein